MEKITIAVPSKAPGGLDANVDGHFGHCEVYTVVELENGKITSHKTLPNVPHDHGGCIAPVHYLASNKVQALIAGGMGARPLNAFGEVGIKVYYSNNLPTVQATIDALLAGSLRTFGQENTCQGGCSGH